MLMLTTQRKFISVTLLVLTILLMMIYCELAFARKGAREENGRSARPSVTKQTARPRRSEARPSRNANRHNEARPSRNANRRSEARPERTEKRRFGSNSRGFGRPNTDFGRPAGRRKEQHRITLPYERPSQRHVERQKHSNKRGYRGTRGDLRHRYSRKRQRQP